MARALTSGELTSLRSKQASILWLDVDTPATIFACRVNQTFTTKDKIVEVIFDTVTTGAYGDVLAGMTLLIGSAAGLSDIGMCRIRKSATSTKLFLGENSDIVWADNLYLTVIDEFGIWDKEKFTAADGTVSMDYETAYSDQHNSFYPIVNAGPARRVAKLTSSYIDLQFDLSGSWVLGSTLSTYSCSAPGSVSVTGGTTATPTIRYNAAGRYRVAFTVTAANGKSTTVYRTVRIWTDASPLISAFILDGSARGSYDNGGWEFSVQVFGTDANIRKGAMVTLVAQDFYNDVETSIGPVTGYENIKAIGWIDGRTINYDPNGGTVSFTVKGPHWWMNQLAGSDVELKNIGGTPASWKEMQGLTIDKALYHLVYWRSTVASIMDVYKSADTRLAPELISPIGSLWSKLDAFSAKILAKPCCDRYGRLFVEIDPQLTEAGSRSGPTVMTLQKGDWLENGLQIKRREIPSESRLVLSTWLVQQGVETQTLYSLTPGHNFKRHGNEVAIDSLLAASQSQSNSMAGLILGEHNREFDFGFSLCMHNDAVDICPAQYVDVNIAAGDTVSGIAYAGKIVVREVELEQDKRGFLLTSWPAAEPESVPENAINGDIPVGAGTWDPPTLPPISIPPIPPIPPLVDPKPDGASVNNVIFIEQSRGVFYTKDFQNSSPHWFAMNDGLPSVNNLVNLEVTSSGRVFVQVGTSAIYSASKFGERWAKVVDVADMTALYTAAYGAPPAPPYDASTVSILSMGINRNAADELMVLARRFDTYGGLWANFCYGTSAGVTIGVELDTNPAKPYAFWLGGASGITYGSNKWEVYTNDNPTILHMCNRNATSMVLSFSGGGNNTIFMSARGNLDGKHFLILDSFKFRKTLDNGTTFTDLTAPPQSPYGAASMFQSVGADPSGSYLMIGQTVTQQRSSDGGATWGNVPVLSGTYTAVWNLGDKDHWIMAGANSIKYTPDFGVTWVDLPGDLLSWISIPVYVLCIRSH